MRQVSLPMVFIVVPLPHTRPHAHTCVYTGETAVFAARWNFPSRANFAYQIIAGKRAHYTHGYGRTYLPEVRAAELHRQIYIVPIGIPAITEMILLHLLDISSKRKKKKKKTRQIAIAYSQLPLFVNRISRLA